MQLSKVTVRLGGSLLHTVPLVDVTPAEILILREVHGQDAVVDIMPSKFVKKSQADEWERLVDKYDKASAMTAGADPSKALMSRLFPGAMKKLPIELAEIGLGHLVPGSKGARKPVEQMAVHEDAADPLFLQPPTDDVADVDIFVAPAEAETA